MKDTINILFFTLFLCCSPIVVAMQPETGPLYELDPALKKKLIRNRDFHRRPETKELQASLLQALIDHDIVEIHFILHYVPKAGTLHSGIEFYTFGDLAYQTHNPFIIAAFNAYKNNKRVQMYERQTHKDRILFLEYVADNL